MNIDEVLVVIERPKSILEDDEAATAQKWRLLLLTPTCRMLLKRNIASNTDSEINKRAEISLVFFFFRFPRFAIDRESQILRAIHNNRPAFAQIKRLKLQTVN